MKKFLESTRFDLISEDGYVMQMKRVDNRKILAKVVIKNIADNFLGFRCDKESIFFNLKSTLAQLGITTIQRDIELNFSKKTAYVDIEIIALNDLAENMLKFLSENSYIGKLFALVEERKVRDPEYLTRMFLRKDRLGKPLLSFGKKNEDLVLEKKQGYTIAFVPILKGEVQYSNEIQSFLAAIGKILKFQNYPIRHLLQLYQNFNHTIEPRVENNKCLLAKTEPLYIRTVFAKVSDKFLEKGYNHTSACILEPDTLASGNIYELFGSSNHVLKNIALEFYTLEPQREYVFFEDRDQLQEKLEDKNVLFNAINTAPKPETLLASTFIVKGAQLVALNESSWITEDPQKQTFPGLDEPDKQAYLVDEYIKKQPSYKLFKAMEDGFITSQGILLSRHFPTPMMKKEILSNNVQRLVKRIYFQYPSRSNDEYFSHEDRAFLLDLAKFGIPTYWLDKTTNKILKYVLRHQKDAGMFVPLDLIQDFRKATFFGVYGSNLIQGRFDEELQNLLQGVLELKKNCNHSLLSKNIPLALVTGGGPGAMEVGNKVAKKLNIISCANIVDFRTNGSSVVNEQKVNPHIDAKMSYRLDRLVERQAEFYLDFPMFLMGGIGADFELLLEEVNRKTGSSPANPVLLFGDVDYWQAKITSRFEMNMKTQTIKGSEWVSNCFYVIQTADQGLKIYKDFFENKLPIGKKGPVYKKGFCESYE